MIIFVLVSLLAFSLYAPTPRGAYHLLLLLGYFGLYAAPLPVGLLRRAAGLLTPVVMITIILAPWGNSNSMAMWAWALYFFADYTWAEEGETIARIAATVLCGWALYTTGCEGAWVALFAGICVQGFGWRGAGAGGALLALVAWTKRGVVGSFTTRLDMLQMALDGFLRKPLGHGLGAFAYWRSDGWGAWHAHNLFADVGYTLGIGGLAALAALLLIICRAKKPGWAGGFLAAFLAHSLVDGPLWYGPGALLFITLKEVDIEHYLDTVWRGIGAYLCRYRFGPAAAAQTPVSVDTRPADTAGAGLGE